MYDPTEVPESITLHKVLIKHETRGKSMLYFRDLAILAECRDKCSLVTFGEPEEITAWEYSSGVYLLKNREQDLLKIEVYGEVKKESTEEVHTSS